MDKFKEFVKDREADKWSKENYGEWLEKLKKDEYTCFSNDIADLLYCYTGNMNLEFNRIMRGYTSLYLEDIEEYTYKIDIINSNISKFELKENIVVWRYTDNKVFKTLFENQKIKVGANFVEKGFMSTTLIAKKLEKFAFDHKYNTLLKLYLPKGAKGAYVDFEKGMLDEKEFLLPRDSKFILRKKQYKFFQWPTYIYECELML
ncbi:ADP-ribosyltransferase [Clostridium butyricum]|uniref:ADP-ribosyltransferase n=1 Tax=Clostridium butyricum TaxID=1492 RepID=UPI00374EAFF0